VISLADYGQGLDPRSAAFQTAWDAAVVASQNDTLYIPPGVWRLSRTIAIDRLQGAPGSVIEISPTFAKAGRFSKYAIENQGFDNSGSPSLPASTMAWIGVTIQYAATQPLSLVGLANVAGGTIDGCSFTATSADKANVYAVDALLDVMASVKGLQVTRSKFANLTGRHGAQVNTGGGGGAIWIRNVIVANGNLSANATDGVVVSDCDIDHGTSDEAIAIYGVRGIVRNCLVNNCRIRSSQSTGNAAGEPLHNVFMSIFPGDDGSGVGKGDNAQVYGNAIRNCTIVDSACAGNMIRVGYSAPNDQNNQCYSNEISGNKLNVTAPLAYPGSAVILGNEDLYSDHGAKSDNLAFGNTICLSDSGATKVWGVAGFQRQRENKVRGPFTGGYMDAAQQNPLVKAIATVVNGVTIFTPETGTEADIQQQAGGLFIRKDGNNQMWYWPGTE